MLDSQDVGTSRSPKHSQRSFDVALVSIDVARETKVVAELDRSQLRSQRELDLVSLTRGRGVEDNDSFTHGAAQESASYQAELCTTAPGAALAPASWSPQRRASRMTSVDPAGEREPGPSVAPARPSHSYIRGCSSSPMTLSAGRRVLIASRASGVILAALREIVSCHSRSNSVRSASSRRPATASRNFRPIASLA
jgi:hypothetical protein